MFFLINRIVAFFIKIFKLKRLEPKWPLIGVVDLKISGAHLKFHSNCDDYLISNIYYDNESEEITEIELMISKLALKENLQFMDIGSYNGLFSIAFGKMLPSSHAFAFEPNPANFKRLCKNIDLNGLTNVEAYNIGISDKQGFLEMCLPADGSMTTVSSYDFNFTKNHAKNPLKILRTKVETIDSFCAAHDVIPDFIKIDVENHEHEVILGGMATIKKTRPIIFCEIFTRAFSNKDLFQRNLPKVFETEAFLNGLGYRIYTVSHGGFVELDSLNHDSMGRNFLFLPHRLKSSKPFNSL
jgi:FkbM family methyltransferase